MMERRWLVAASCITLLLTACGGPKGPSGPKSKQDIAEELKEAVTLINYMDKGGHGTGFFVRGSKDVCTVVTARHVVEASNKLQLQTVDGELWQTSNIEYFPNHDLAVVTFAPEGKTCPYRALHMGDSDRVKEGDTIYIRGFPAEEARRGVSLFSSGTVSGIVKPPILEGYSLFYEATTADGMSGAPVVNVDGQVIGVHGRTDIEIIRIASSPQSNIPPEEQERLEEQIRDIHHIRGIHNFKCGVPINVYKEEKSKIENAKILFEEGLEKNKNGMYEEAIASFEKAIEIKPDYYQAWHNRGEALVSLERYDEAIASFKKAIEIKRDNDKAWNNRGEALVSLGKHYEAIFDFGDAIKINPDYYQAWNNRGEALVSLKRYYEAMADFDDAIKIKPDYYQAWNNRGWALVMVKRYYEAIASFEKAIEIKLDFHEAWTGRGYALEELERYDEALESYDKAIKFDPNNQEAINNRKLLLKKLGQPE